jgi:phage shock protein A
LRPVTFRYKTDPKSVRQYGLIAEEVDRVYPELVIRDDSGKIMGVHYEELAPMLLGELQRQQATVQTLSAHNAQQAGEIRRLKSQHEEMQKQLAELSDLKLQMRAALRQMHPTPALVAQR